MIRDVKIYFLKVQSQRLAIKEDLKDFEKALKDGQITEDRLEGIKAEYDVVDANYQRLAYVLYLLDLPKKENYKNKYKRANKDLLEALKDNNADEEAIIKEDEDALKRLKEEIKKIKAEIYKDKPESGQNS